MRNNTTLNMTEGKPLVLLSVFALPLLIGNLFQQACNLADSMIVGRFASERTRSRWRAAGLLFTYGQHVLFLLEYTHHRAECLSPSGIHIPVTDIRSGAQQNDSAITRRDGKPEGTHQAVRPRRRNGRRKAEEEKAMKQRIPGRTGRAVSEIGLGTWQLGTRWGDPSDQEGLIAKP